MFSLASFLLIWLHMLVISKTSSLPSDYIQFGGTKEESRQAAYYLSADSGANTGPTDELRRTQRSFWRNLFRHGLFGDCGNYCNNYKYVVGSSEINNPLQSAFPLSFKPWQALPFWRPLQPLFGSMRYDNNYAPTICDNSKNYAPTLSYAPPYGNTLSELAPRHPGNNLNAIPAEDNAYKTDYKSIERKNIYTIPNLSPQAPQYINGKVPQIVYQPIMYQGRTLNRVNQDNIRKLNEDDGSEYQSSLTKIESEEERPPCIENVTGNNDYSNVNYNGPIRPVAVTPDSQTYSEAYDQLAPPCLSHQHHHPNPSISTLSTVCNVIPSSLTAVQSPNPAILDVPNVSYFNENMSTEGQSKYSLYPLPLQIYSPPTPASSLIPPPVPSSQVDSVPASMEDSPQYYSIQPIRMTIDDQPYRACPELFSEYERKLKEILPNSHSGPNDNTFVNAQPMLYD